MDRVPERGFSFHVSKNPEKDLRLQILVCGKTGIGKSALINSVIGRKICKSGGPGSGERADGEALEPVTKSVNAVESNSNGIIITVWDSPGLQDGTSMEKVYLQDMYDKCKNVDLVYYCIDMTTVRWLDGDENALRLMAEKFDTTFWSKCILVLTKANSVRVPPAKRMDKKAYFEQLCDTFKKQFQNKLEARNVPKDISTEIPVTCAGIIDGEDAGPGTPSHNERYLYFTSNQGDYSDGERKHFLSELWLISFQRLPIESRLKYKRATGDRKRFTEDVHTIIEEMCESKEDEVKANNTNGSQNKSEDGEEDAEKNQSGNKSEDEIEDAQKNQSGESQNISEDEIEDDQSSESEKTREDQKEDTEEKNKLFYEQYKHVTVAELMKGTDLPMDDSQKNRLKKISVRKNVKRGAIIGGIAGSVIPIAGSLVGAAVGAGVGAVIARAKKKKYHK